MNFSHQEMADMHFLYGWCRGSARAARIEYQLRFPNRRLPTARMFTSIHQRFQDGSLFRNLAAENQPRRINAEISDQVLAIVEQDPAISTRRVALRTGLSHSSVHRILRAEGMHPYHHTPVQALLPADFESRRLFCNILLERSVNDPMFLNRILWTDESQFTRDGVFNFHNTHLWSNENPHSIRVGKSQHRFHLNVWAGIIGNNLVGPYFFEGTLTGPVYLDFLQNQLQDLLEEVPINNLIGMYLLFVLV